MATWFEEMEKVWMNLVVLMKSLTLGMLPVSEGTEFQLWTQRGYWSANVRPIAVRKTSAADIPCQEVVGLETSFRGSFVVRNLSRREELQRYC